MKRRTQLSNLKNIQIQRCVDIDQIRHIAYSYIISILAFLHFFLFIYLTYRLPCSLNTFEFICYLFLIDRYLFELVTINLLLPIIYSNLSHKLLIIVLTIMSLQHCTNSWLSINYSSLYQISIISLLEKDAFECTKTIKSILKSPHCPK